MGLLLDILFAALAFWFTEWVLHHLGVVDPLAFVIAIIIAVVVFLQHWSAGFER